MDRGEIPISVIDGDGQARPVTAVTYHAVNRAPFWFREGTKKVAIRDGAPPAVLEVDDAYFMPGSLCLYDKDGVRIPESCVRRGEGLAELVNAGPETIAVPKECRIIEAPALYLSFLPRHWGHFLTESTSRLWARLAYPELKEIAGFYARMATRSGESSYFQFLGQFGLAVGDTVYSSAQPLRLKKCFIPHASFSNRAEAYSAHRAPFEFVSRGYLDGSEVMSDQPVFISRTRFAAARNIKREAEAEEMLANAGYRIVHPELLSLKEQVQLFNTHKTFVGCWGSAFHNVIFSLKPELCTTHVMCSQTANPNFLMFDAIDGNHANYVNCLMQTAEQAWPEMDLELDVDQFAEYLRGQSLL